MACVLRLVNFAYGQLIMAGAYALAFASERGWPVSVGILLCFAVVLTLSLLMDRIVFRPLRAQTPAVMLVATFAVAFLLQSIALLWFGPLGKIASSLATLNQPVTISGVDIRKIAIVATGLPPSVCSPSFSCSNARASACTCGLRPWTSAPQSSSVCARDV